MATIVVVARQFFKQYTFGVDYLQRTGAMTHSPSMSNVISFARQGRLNRISRASPGPHLNRANLLPIRPQHSRAHFAVRGVLKSDAIQNRILNTVRESQLAIR